MVTVFGLGFVGLTTALGFAHLGYEVYGVDVNTERKDLLRSGKLPFLEPYMEEQLQKHLNVNFHVVEDPAQAVQNSEYIYYCVGTPYGQDGSADLTYLFSAIDTTLAAIHDDKFRVLVTKSTIPPTTTAEKIYPYIRSKGALSAQLGVANNPEFLREGHCWEDFLGAARVVLGCNDEKSRQMLIKLYGPMNIPIKCVSHTTGEFIKYLSNTLLATMISYSNEMAQAAEAFGDIDVAEAFRILHMDKRWNDCNMRSYVYPGCGYGGYCLPKDTCALYAQSVEKGFTPKILENVISTNNMRPKVVAQRIAAELPTDGQIGILGLSFKPHSDDVRDTAAAKILKELMAMGYSHFHVYDPAAMEEFRKYYPEISADFAGSAREVYESSQVIAIVTTWPEFKDVPGYGNKKIVDCRYML